MALPKSLCSMVLFLKGFIFLSLPLNITAIVIAKYMFICRWKRMKIMQDKLIARIIIIGISGISTFLWSIKSLFQERPVINMVRIREKKFGFYYILPTFSDNLYRRILRKDLR